MKKPSRWRWTSMVVIAVFVVGCENDKIEEAPAATEVQIELNPQVIETGRALASACARCHGLDGANGQGTAPFIAGQSMAYLTSALFAYTTGDRRHAAMKAAVTPLSDGERTAIAAYYASLEGSWPRARQNKQKAADREAIEAGRTRSRACAPCHGTDGHSTRPGIPSLAGLQAEYFRKAVGDYLNDKRQNPLMEVFKHALSRDDIENLTAYYASLTPRKRSEPAAGNAANGNKLASTRCSGCHGVAGLSVNPTIPNLFGHDAQYLIGATKAYRDGARDNAMMKQVVAGLSDGAIEDIAAHYAGQDVVAAKPVATSDVFDPITEGARLSETCSGCHGEEGNSVIPGIPSLTRQHPAYLIAVVQAYQNGTRHHRQMKAMVEHLSTADIEKISYYYATREPLATTHQVKGDSARGGELVASCSACHGEGGNSTDAATPSLAGQDPAYLAAAIRAYADESRSHSNMKDAVASLSEQDYLDVAAYYAAQQPAQPKVRALEEPTLLAEKCDRCHGTGGHSDDPTRPRLAGQRQEYLFAALRAYAASERNNSAMYAMSADLAEVEMQAIARYYANQ